MHDHTHHQHSTIYVCEGECGARLTEEEYKAHPTKVCGAENCSHKGQPFTAKQWCEDCKEFCNGCESCNE